MTLAELRAIAEAATPGPWEVARAPAFRNAAAVVTGNRWAVALCPVAPLHAPRERATHIATFDPPTVLALLDVVGALAKHRDCDGWACPHMEACRCTDCDMAIYDAQRESFSALSHLDELLTKEER